MADLGKTEGLLVIKGDNDNGGGLACAIGIESTVCSVSLDGRKVTVLRCGAIGSQAIGAALHKRGIKGVEITVQNEAQLEKGRKDGNKQEEEEEGVGVGSTGDQGAIAPGQLLKHYAPDVNTYVMGGHTLSAIERERVSTNATAGKGKDRAVALLSEGVSIIDYQGQLSSLQTSKGKSDGRGGFYRDLSVQGDVHEACRVLFSVLREAEEAGQTLLLPDLRYVTGKGEGDEEMMQALWERLRRAASGDIL